LQDQTPFVQWQMGPQISKPPQNMPSSSQHDPSTGAALGKPDVASPMEQDQAPGEPIHAQSRFGLTHCVFVEQASGGGASHPPEVLPLLAIPPLPLLAVTLPVLLAPPAAPPVPPEPPDPCCVSTVLLHAASITSSDIAAE